MKIDKMKKQIKVHCLNCGRTLMKASGNAEIEIKCSKCGSEIITVIDGEIISVLRTSNITPA